MHSTDERLASANELLETLDLDGAESALRLLLSERPDWPEALRSYGVLEHLRGHHESAITYLDHALAVNPGDATAFVCAGQVHRSLGNLILAEANLRQALALDPTRHDAHLNLALTLWAMGKIAQARTYFKNVIQLGKKTLQAQLHLGNLEWEEGNLDAAAEQFVACLALDANQIEARAQLAQIRFERGNVVEAALEMERVANEAGEMPGRLLAAAKYLFEVGSEVAAMKLADQAIRAESSGTGETGRFGVSRGNWSDIVSWCERENQAIARIAKEQRHTVREPKFLGADSDGLPFPEPTTPDVFLATIPDCLVYPEGLIPQAADGSVFLYRVMHDALRIPHANTQVIHGSDDGRLLIKKGICGDRQVAQAIYLGDHPDYGEWLFKGVTRLWSYAQRPSLTGLPIVVRAEFHPWRRELLDLLGIPSARRIDPPTDGVLRCDQLHVATETAPVNFVAPFALEFLRRSLQKTIAPLASSPGRVFVSQGSQGRQLANFDALWPTLEAAGFTLIDSSAMTLADLLRLFMSSQIILGLADDAMANVFVAPARAKIGLIVGGDANAGRYAAPSMTLGQEFTFLAADVDYSSSDVLDHCDLLLNEDLLLQFLATL